MKISASGSLKIQMVIFEMPLHKTNAKNGPWGVFFLLYMAQHCPPLLELSVLSPFSCTPWSCLLPSPPMLGVLPIHNLMTLCVAKMIPKYVYFGTFPAAAGEFCGAFASDVLESAPFKRLSQRRSVVYVKVLPVSSHCWVSSLLQVREGLPTQLPLHWELPDSVPPFT